MLRILNVFAGVGCLALGLQSSLAFSLLGPNNETWQTPEIGYNPLPSDGLPTAPKNLGEEFRRNTPVLYYSFDANFLEYFGPEGANAVDQAMQILNSLTNVSSYSANLSEFPTAVTRENYLAAALRLRDVKSHTLHLMMEQLGLAEPERYIWTLHNRFVGPGGCPLDMDYLVVKRNWEISQTPLNQYQATSYVNSTLYSYFISETCSGTPTAEAIEFPVDPLDRTFTAVAASFNPIRSNFRNSGLLYPGRFYTGLTRDDVAGLRYLLREKNMNWESPGPNALSLVTNTQPQLLYSSNLTLLASQALTNDAATLQGLYPGLIVTDSTNWFETVYVTTLVPYFTNSPYDPAYTPPRLNFTTVRTREIRQKYNHKYDNLRVAVYTNGGWAAVSVSDLSSYMGYGVETLVEESVLASGSPYNPALGAAVTTNVTQRTYSTNQVVGEYFILSSNVCDVVLIAPQLTFTNSSSNLLVSISTTYTISNATTVTNVTESYTASVYNYWTNHAFSALPITCLQSNVALLGGIEKMTFVRRDFDSLLGRFFTPITNNYTLTTLTNNTYRPMRVIRPVSQPDFLFTAIDSPLTPGPNGDSLGMFVYNRNVSFATNGIAYYPGLAGPGTIESPSTITFNKGAPVWYNVSDAAYDPNLAEADAIVYWYWGSYDGSTNAPIIYPNGTSLQNLENQLAVQISPESLADGTLAVPYQWVYFSATGGQPPYSWSIAPGSTLPPGLSLSSTGVLSGTPAYAATYGFVVRMTDAGAKVVDRYYSLTINRY